MHSPRALPTILNAIVCLDNENKELFLEKEGSQRVTLTRSKNETYNRRALFVLRIFKGIFMGYLDCDKVGATSI